jgi:predicted nuclease of predicted toxin-antitoxin system
VKFLLDHDVPDDIEYSLAALGHTVLKLREVLPTTAPDEEVLRLAGQRDCVLIPLTASNTARPDGCAAGRI